MPHHVPQIRARRRSASVVLALGLALATVGVTATPAYAVKPKAPILISAQGYSDGVRVYFAPAADDPGQPVDHYEITRHAGIATFVTMVPTSAMYNDTGATVGVEYEYTVYAVNADGGSVASNVVLATRTAGVDDLAKFTSPAAFITGMYQRFLGRAPTTDEAVGAGVAAGATSANSAFLKKLILDPSRGARGRVIRLYLAYFKRNPDHGGLAYWVGQLQAGTKTINDVSNNFASSNEFRTTYGKLSNVDFVTLVYQNVLNRDPEPSGFAFWTGQLDQKLVVRGRVMTQFSESNEYRNATKTRVLDIDVQDAIVGKAATNTLYQQFLDGGGSIGDEALSLLRAPTFHGDKS